jgi:hypothetical protein
MELFFFFCILCVCVCMYYRTMIMMRKGGSVGNAQQRMQTFMSTRASSLFRLGAVRRLPMPDGSWELDNSSVLGTVDALEALEP